MVRLNPLLLLHVNSSRSGINHWSWAGNLHRHHCYDRRLYLQHDGRPLHDQSTIAGVTSNDNINESNNLWWYQRYRSRSTGLTSGVPTIRFIILHKEWCATSNCRPIYRTVVHPIQFTGLSAGTYTNVFVTIVSNNCPSNTIASIILTDPNTPAITTTFTNPTSRNPTYGKHHTIRISKW